MTVLFLSSQEVKTFDVGLRFAVKRERLTDEKVSRCRDVQY